MVIERYGLGIVINPEEGLVGFSLDPASSARKDAPVGFLRVDYPPGWSEPTIEFGGDELRITRTAPDGSTSLVQHVFDRTWHFRVSTELAAGASVLPPVIAPVGELGPLVWDGGELGWLIWPLPGCFVFGELIGGQSALAPNPDAAGPARIRSEWRLQTVGSLREVAGRLPSWWPERTALWLGDEVGIDLPDGVVGTELPTRTIDTQTLIDAAEVGCHDVAVRDRSSVVSLPLSVAEPMESLLASRAREVLALDPRTCHLGAAVVLARALDWQVIGEDEAGEALAELVDRLPKAVDDPLLVSLASSQARRTGDPDDLRRAIDAVAGLSLWPGALLAWLEVAVQAGAANLRPPDPPTVRPELDYFDDHLVRLEQALLAGDPAADALADLLLTVLGPGLPAQWLDGPAVGRALAVSALVGEGSQVGRSWPVDLGQARQDALLGLLAIDPTDQLLCWLTWRVGQ